MSTGFGRKSWVGFANEVTYGTPVASAKFLELQEESMKLDNPVIDRPTLRQLTRVNMVPGKKSVDGSVKVQFPATGMEYLIDAAMGRAQVVTGASSPYEHAWALHPSGGTIPSVALHIARDPAAIGGTSSHVYHGCMVQKLTLVQEAEDFLTAEFEFVGEDESYEAAETPTFPTFAGFHWAQLSCSINSVVTPIKRWELTIENPLATDRFNLGTRTRVGLGRSGGRRVSGSIELEWSALTERAFFTGQTSTALLFDYNISATQRLQLLMDKVYFQEAVNSVADAGPIPLKMSFDAYSTGPTFSELSIALTNATATY